MKTNILIFVFIGIVNLFLITSASAQDKVKVHASGTSISRDLTTPKDALKEAIQDAQINAFRKAGISEQISVSSISIGENSKNKVSQYFNEISTIESNANIVVDSIYTEEKSFDKFGNMVISVEIDATVFKYNKEKDPAFFFKIEGLKEVYYDNEAISFSFVPSQDGYLKIFVLNTIESQLLYPFENTAQIYLSDQKDQLFKRNKKVAFPILEVYQPGYSIELENTGEDENSTLIFVFTKNNISWIDSKINKNTILNWIYNIPIDQREIEFRNILLKANK